jgi:hypothetical protein
MAREKSERRGVPMNGKELLERGLRRGVALWRLEEELDWRENQAPRRAEHNARPAPATIRSDMASTSPLSLFSRPKG